MNRGNGNSEIEGKGAQGSAERVGRRVSFNRGRGNSEIEDKAPKAFAASKATAASVNLKPM